MKAAVIGCGAQGRGGHVANYNKIDDVDLVAVCDVNLEQAQTVATEFGVPNVYSDYRELLDKHNLDLLAPVHHTRFTGTKPSMRLKQVQM